MLLALTQRIWTRSSHTATSIKSLRLGTAWIVTTSGWRLLLGSGQTAFTMQEGQKGGDERMDYLKKKRIKTIAGRELITNIHALAARLDLICMKYWFRVESKPCALFDVDGITVFPLYGGDGGVATAQAFYFVCGMNTATSRPRSGAYSDTLSKPNGF